MTARGETIQQLRARITELEESLARAERSAEALREVGLALGSTLDLDQLLELILKKITELLEGDRATLYLLDEQRRRLFSRIMVGDEARSIELPLGQGIAGHVAKVGRAVRVKDAYRDKRFQREWDDLSGYKTRSILAAPMKNHVGRTIGVIQVLNKKQGDAEFSQHDEELLTALATQAAVSIDNSRLFLSVIQKNMQLVETKEQLERRVADLKLLFDLETAMSGAATMDDLARAVVVEAARACDARAGALLVDESEGGVWLYVLDQEALRGAQSTRSVDANDAGEEPAAVKRIAFEKSDGIIGWAMTHNEAMSFPEDIERLREQELEAAPPRICSVFQSPVVSAIAAPLEGEDGGAIGAIALYNSRKRTGFSQDDRSLLRLVSANASTALRLFRSRIERERSERLTTIGRLLSGVMHDMRTPLTVISGYVQLMAMASDPKQRSEHARIILKQFDLLSAMQREVLEFARGERSVLVRKVYLTRFFEDIERQLRRELDGTGIALVVELEDRGTARFDESKITRVIHNLTRNAVEAMGGQGVLRLRVAREGNDFVLSVSDTGRGIPTEIRDKLFQSFVTMGKRGGTGLGLAIVKKIVDEHGGSIEIQSSDKGATFTVRLPQDGPHAQASDALAPGGRTPAQNL